MYDRSSLPPGRMVRLAGRGEVFVRELPGPPDAPVMVLLHGWTATADLNWHLWYRSLARRYRVVAFDVRGHGRGLRTGAGFRLEDCADDVAAVAEALGIERLIPVGYSMGGPIASLVWRRHPQLVEGLVLCATSRHFGHTAGRRALFSLLGGGSALAATPPVCRAMGRLSCVARARRSDRRADLPAMLDQVLRHDWAGVLAAGCEIGRFDSRPWAGEIDVPTAVVVALDDGVVPTAHQLELADAVPGASLHLVRGGHAVCTDRAGRFGPTLLEACQSVATRADRRVRIDRVPAIAAVAARTPHPVPLRAA